MKNIRVYFAFEGLLVSFLLSILLIHRLQVLAPSTDSVVLITAAVIGSLPIFYSAYRGVVRREISMDLLAGVALLVSMIGKEWSSAIFIALMLSAARSLTVWNEKRTERSIDSLLKLRPERAKVYRGGTLLEVPAEQIVVGDIVVVDLGGRIPIDGVVVKGFAAVDESSLTGESLPVDKAIDSKVFSSTLVSFGGIEIRAEKVGTQTTLERMIELIKSAREEKPGISTLAEKFGKIYIVSVFLVSVLLFLLTKNMNLVISVVLVVCADDVAIAVPLAFLSAIGVAARHGVIVKGNRYLEEIGRVETFVFDKTGTLTQGLLRVQKVVALGSVSEEEILKYAASLALRSNHPMSKAIVQHLEQRGLTSVSVENFEEVGGKGTMGLVSGNKIALGKIAFLAEQGAQLSDRARELIEREKREGQSVAIVSRDGELIGAIGVMDEVKPNVKAAIEELKVLGGQRFIMLTGDNEFVAARVAQQVGITEFHANLLPQDKVAYLKKLSGQGGSSVMVGDGVNDAAALEIATIGVAMGSMGYDAAIESANIVLMKDDLSKLVDVVKLSHYLKRVVKQDFWIWGLSNVVGLALVFAGIIGPAGAAAYNFLSDFLPLGNSLKVTRINFDNLDKKVSGK